MSEIPDDEQEVLDKLGQIAILLCEILESGVLGEEQLRIEVMMMIGENDG